MRRLLSLSPALLSSLLLLAAAAPSQAASKFELTTAEKERVEKFLPHCYPKLLHHDPVHIVLLGDSVTGMYVHDENDNNLLRSYGGTFVGLLADQFYYTGGVRVVRPFKGKPEKDLEIHGPEITIRNASRGGKLMIHAMNLIDTVMWDENPDLVIVNFGVNDANSFHNLGTYRRAAQDVIDAARKHGADVMMLGCTLTLTDPPEFGLALTRPYVDTAREVAEANGIFFADLGDLAWLARVDEPMKALEREKKKEDAPAANAATPPPLPSAALPEGQTPGAIIKFPTPDELDPDPEKRAARLFHDVTTDLRAWYDHGTQMDLIHPNSHLHKLLGHRLFAEFLDGPRKVPWAIGPGSALFKDANQFALTYRVENLTDAPLRVSLLPLVVRGWKPVEAETQLELKEKRKGPITVTYARDQEAGNSAMPSSEPLLRLPVMVLGSGVARIEQVRANLQPCSMVWDLGSQYNTEGEFTLNGHLFSTTNDDFNGSWEAEWMGQKLSGKIENMPGHTQQAIALRFKLPADSTTAIRQRGTLNFTVTTAGLTLPFSRDVEIIRNVGLRDPIPLSLESEYVPNEATPQKMPDATHPGVTFRADADPKALYLTWDMVGMNLADDTNGRAIGIEMNLDARSYGKRLKHGVTDAVRIFCSAADGEGILMPLPVWSFGNGYGNNMARYDVSAVQSRLSSRPDGSRRFTVMIPRNFFYLHEWAIGNGNSELGINMGLLLWQKPDDKNPQGSSVSYAYSMNNFYRDDAEALSTLELTEHGTKRWSVHFY